MAVLGTTYQRAAMAEWLTDVDRGAGSLVARVIVNRLWQYHFGEGLVRTPDDFGARATRPCTATCSTGWPGNSIRDGWRLKPIHRLIVTSATYRQESSPDPRRRSPDPDNRLLSRRRPVRLEAEAIRDAMLTASGRLNRAMYGPAFRPRIPPEAISTRSKDAYPTNIPEGPKIWRRSVYAFVKRSVVNPFAETFDAPDSTSTCGRRNTTTVPTQNLALMNDPFVRGCALVAGASGGGGRRKFRGTARPPRLCAGPRAIAARRRAGISPEIPLRGDGSDSFADLCHVLFTLNEFIYID